jgi:hypothetical protein
MFCHRVFWTPAPAQKGSPSITRLSLWATATTPPSTAILRANTGSRAIPGVNDVPFVALNLGLLEEGRDKACYIFHETTMMVLASFTCVH